MEKRWVIKKPVSQDLQDRFPELDPVVLQLLVNRGIVEEKDVESFLNPDYEADTHDPFLFIDMEKSVKRIFQAIDNKEKIFVHGDYDADGVCASALLISVLRDLGGDVDVYIPHREKEGYGVNKNTIDYVNKKGAKLLITVDCGTANVEPVEYAQSLGIDVIITDHHHVPEHVPKAFALINPQNKKDSYPFEFLCGTGVAFKLAQALFLTDQKKTHSKFAEGYDKWLLDLVAIATVADMMPLLDENRVLVHYGLIVLGKTRRPGLQRLLQSSGIWSNGRRSITPFDIGFIIGPRLNAAGRMDHANSAYELLVTDKATEIEELIENIEVNNRDRKALTDRIVDEVMLQAQASSDDYLIFAYGSGWPIGVAGLVASKVLQLTGKPTIVMTKLEDRVAGSGRSVPGFDMAKALEEIQYFFETSGGHAAACGFSLKEGVKEEEVIKTFKELAKKSLEGKDLRPELDIEMILDSQRITWNLYDNIQDFSPFGKGNEEPVFVTKDLIVEDVRAVGDQEKHLKLRLQDPKLFKSFSAIAFGFGNYLQNLKVGSKVDVAYKIDANEWNGNRELQLKIEDIDIL